MFITLRVWLTGVAALKFPLPPWLAVMVVTPGERAVTEVPDTLATLVLELV
jgi:hypothetical protein